MVVAAGDFANRHEGLDEAIDVLCAIEVPTVLVPGNNETGDALRSACAGWSAATVLHGEGAELDGVPFYGLGAGVPVTPFDWSFDLSDEQAEPLLEDCPERCVLVVHSPPKGYLDATGGQSIGSEAILRTIEDRAPRLAVCGHVHDAPARRRRSARRRSTTSGRRGRCSRSERTAFGDPRLGRAPWKRTGYSLHKLRGAPLIGASRRRKGRARRPQSARERGGQGGGQGGFSYPTVTGMTVAGPGVSAHLTCWSARPKAIRRALWRPQPGSSSRLRSSHCRRMVSRLPSRCQTCASELGHI